LEDAVVVVTGGGTGVGQGLAFEASRRGARVVIAAPDPADETLARIEKSGGQAIWVQSDVSSHAQMNALAREVVSHFGGVNLLINNAILSASGGRLQDCDPDMVKRQYEVNILGVFNGIHAFFPHLKASADRGALAHVLNVGSEHSFGIPPYVPPISSYTVTKYTSLGFTDTCRRDFEGTGIGVSLLAPSWVLTDGLRRLLGQLPDEMRTEIEAHYQTTEEVARAAFDGIAEGRHIIATNAVSTAFIRDFTLERLSAFEQLKTPSRND
jgi:NAD(P)-dependent dehydrogenase (short-subunit alcohol dehydrogenase family)